MVGTCAKVLRAAPRSLLIVVDRFDEFGALAHLVQHFPRRLDLRAFMAPPEEGEEPKAASYDLQAFIA